MPTLRRRDLVGVSVALFAPRLARADEPSPSHVAPSASPAKPPRAANSAPPGASPPSIELRPGTGDAPLGAPTTDRDRTAAATYVIPVAGTDLVIGGAVIDVRAPLADVTKILGEFHRYKEILPRLQQSRVVAEEGDKTDVYMRAPILHGLAAVWGVARFGPFEPYKTRGVQRQGELVSGNIEKWSGRWVAFPCGERRTLLKLELFCRLSIPLPSRVVNKWLLWACRKGVSAVRDMAECGVSSVAKD
ncbi:MAG: hypothetical protein FJ095_15785 [Deltaproteobacteria bacterium]|nr:hypothetical protein [Deltaproteobacteria bacterium]